MMRIAVANLLAVAILTGCGRDTSWSARIISKQERPLLSLVSPHAEAVNVLVVDGKRFENVRGVNTFYIPLRQINAILFVTDEKDYSVTYHVIKMGSGQEISIPASASVFGRCIGMKQPCDTVRQVSSAEIILCNVGKSGSDVRKSLIYLDLDRKAVTAEK